VSGRRVLLTGGAGFIGSHLARQLVAEGHQVFAIVRPGADRWRLADVAGDLAIIEGDLRRLGDLRGELRAARPDICLHLAWHGWSGKAEAEQNLTSLGISLDLLLMMVDLSCPRFVAVGTCFEYDLSADLLSERTRLEPRELYGTCKKSLFEVTQQFSALTGISAVTPRVFYSYGPFEDERRLVPSVVLALLRNQAAKVTPGEQVRDYLHVEDVASAIWRVAASDRTGAVNVASGEPVTIAALATRMGELLQRPELVQLGAMPYRDGEPMRILGDATLLRQELGWTPRFDLDRGLAETIGWWAARVDETRRGIV
jgi:nucleoside-diphosphate-sugar epimerase